MSKSVTRLYKQFAPENYKLHIKIGDDNRSFSGSIEIIGKKTGRPSQRITLHQKDLKISNVKVVSKDKKGNQQTVELSRVVLQNSYDEVRLHSESTFYPGQYILSMDFSGIITKNMDGIYPCFYEEDGLNKELVATQFESHHAREAFPCIDEPEAKTTFDLSVTHKKNETALGNMPVLSEETNAHSKTTQFEQTPIMSTYLLAFVIGELGYKEATSKNGVKIRTYATRDQVQHTQFALDVAVKCMDYYEDYYDIPFPIKKCDFIALPDFASGAMENWGLITFREQTLLCDDKNTSLGTKQYVAIVVAHELTHQWFGNLVTMRWWTDLWLNEGFASWMEYLAIDYLFPDWKLWSQFAVDDQQMAMKLDALEFTHPIEVSIKHPDEIRTIFDAISYNKGASVIHMLNNYLGSEGFRDGLRHYLKTHAYKNTDTVDLWQALEDVTEKPVKSFMGSWTSQSGFPLLEVDLKDNHLVVSQTRFVANPKSPARDDATLWPVPLLTDELEHSVLNKKLANVPIASNAVVKINNGQTGFYRARYSKVLQQRQLEALTGGTISPIDAMGLLADSFEVTKAGYQPVQDYLELIRPFANSHDLAVWEIISGSIGTIRATLSVNDTSEELRNAMNPFIVQLTSTQRERLTWTADKHEDHLDTLLRPIVIGMSVGADHDDDVTKARELYDQKIINDTEIDPDLRGIVYASVAKHGGEKEFKELLKLYKNTTSSDEKLAITSAMTNFKQSELHQKVLSLITSDTIRLQDVSYWIAYSLMNRYSREATWQWLQKNWEWLKTNIGTDLSFSRIPIYVARCFSDEKYMSEYQDFFTNQMEPMLERSYQQGLEMIETSTAWRSRDADEAIAWFHKINN